MSHPNLPRYVGPSGVVCAVKIAKLREETEKRGSADPGRIVEPEGAGAPFRVSPMLIARCAPKPGQYFVIGVDKSVDCVDAAVFESEYVLEGDTG